MMVSETKLKGCFVVEPTIFEDDRGHFFESYNQAKLAEVLGYKPNFIQDNQSKSQYGVVRGLHMQMGEYAQAKLVRVVEGSVIDVVVDVRKDSQTFGEHFSVMLSAENKKQLFIPRGFLHGFSVVSDSAIFLYKCDNAYNKSSEDGVHPLDNEIGIDWGISIDSIILSEKDAQSKSFSDFKQSL